MAKNGGHIKPGNTVHSYDLTYHRHGQVKSYLSYFINQNYIK